MTKTISLLIVFVIVYIFKSNAQTIIKMKQENGIYTMPCEVNGLKLRFIFDTGASDISISLTEAVFMLKNGYLSEEDITGITKYSVANGDITEGTTLNLREVTIGNLKLHNVKASVIHTLEAPLLLGQSALKRLGKIEFDYSNNTLIINNGNPTEFYLDNSSDNTFTEIPQKLDYYSFRKLPRQEQYSILKNSNLALKQFYKHKRLRTTGITITSIGTGIILTGIILDLTQNDLDGSGEYNDTGGYVAAVGAGVAAVGIGLWALAPKKLKDAVYYYNKEHNLSINFTPTLNGVGLTLKF